MLMQDVHLHESSFSTYHSDFKHPPLSVQVNALVIANYTPYAKVSGFPVVCRITGAVSAGIDKRLCVHIPSLNRNGVIRFEDIVTVLGGVSWRS